MCGWVILLVGSVMGGRDFKPPRLAAAHEVWSIVERTSWSVYRDVAVKSGWVMRHFQWSWEFAYIQGVRSSEMLCEKHIQGSLTCSKLYM